MANDLNGKRVAILATDGFEQVELTEPMQALKQAGARVEVVAPKSGDIQGFNHHDKGQTVPVDHTLEQVQGEDFDALMLPGGVINPDALRLEPAAIDFIRHFVEARKPIAAICHGPWTLINAGGVQGRRMTSWPSLEADLRNAGAEWVDQDVVVDRGLVTSRKPDDLPVFCTAMVEEFSEGRHEEQPGGRIGSAQKGESAATMQGENI
ncbi:MAG TPA: type 1 glutamine amidotransferase domain-containing protein [Pedomonas sp.]|uniref:type 1 glutamine amidotransferase domain-containing protein n=1 Tax=Pedomonas sp. TaxID=2976421 RepID=UPI002F419169